MYSNWNIYDGIVCLEFSFFINDLQIKKTTISTWISRGKIKKARRGGNKKSCLIIFESCEQEIKEKIIEKIGFPPKVIK